MVYEKIHRGATNTMAATFIAAALIGGYTVFSHVSMTSAMTESTVKVADGSPVEIAAAVPQPVIVRDVAPDRRESVVAVVNEPDTTGALAAAANAVNPPLAVIALPALAPPSVLAPADAKTLRERGMFAYRGGDLGGALAHFNLAIAQDPGFAAAYIDRGIVFYRMRNFDRAFADMAQAKRLAKPTKEQDPNTSRRRPRSRRHASGSGQAPAPRWRMTAAVTP